MHATLEADEASPQQAAGYQTEGHCRGDTTVSPPSSLCKVTSEQAPRNLLIEDPFDAVFIAIAQHRSLQRQSCVYRIGDKGSPAEPPGDLGDVLSPAGDVRDVVA